MKNYLPLFAMFVSALSSAQVADSTGADRLHMSPPIASEGGKCNTSEVKSDASGNILYCQSGIWNKVSATEGSVVGTFSVVVNSSDGVDSGICIASKGSSGIYYFKRVCPVNSYAVATYYTSGGGGGD